MNEQFDQLVDYIKQHLNQGVPEDNIRQALRQHNWDEELVNKAFLSVNAPTPPSVYQPPQPNPASYQALATQTPELGQQTGQVQSSAPQATQQPQAEPLAPKKYSVFRALGDTFRAIRKNAAAFLLAVVVSYAVAAGSLFLISLLISKLLYGQFGLLFASTSKLLTVLFGSLILYTLWYAFAYAFVLAATSLAINDGSEGRKSSIGTTVSNSFARTGRVVVANTLFSLVSFWPIVLIIFLPIILLTSGHTGGSSSLILVPILLLVAVIWAYIATIRFALAPYVALFEPNIPITKTLGRSKHLLLKGGQWFLVKGFLLLLLIVIVIAVATHQNLPELMNSNNIAINIVLIITSIVVNGALVMLYHNRKIVRG